MFQYEFLIMILEANKSVIKRERRADKREQMKKEESNEMCKRL